MKRETEIELFSDNQSNWDSEFKKIEMREHMQNISERKRYANRGFIFLICWLVVVVTILILNGTGVLHLSDTILSALVGSPVIYIFGFHYLVLRYLFENKKK
jgi:hypothetical protein